MNADGGNWIKSGMKRIAGITYVLDEFHLEKYMTKLTSHMKDSREDACNEVRTAIKSKTKKEFIEIEDRLEKCLKAETGSKRIEDAKKNTFCQTGPQLSSKDGIKGSSTEGHVRSYTIQSNEFQTNGLEHHRSDKNVEAQGLLS